MRDWEIKIAKDLEKERGREIEKRLIILHFGDIKNIFVTLSKSHSISSRDKIRNKSLMKALLIIVIENIDFWLRFGLANSINDH